MAKFKKISFSGKERTLNFIWDWFIDQKEAINDLSIKIKNSIISGNYDVRDFFLGKSIDEIESYFQELLVELEYLVSLDLIVAAEAILRKDFYKKIEKVKSVGPEVSDSISKEYFRIFKIKGHKVSLKEDILEVRKRIFPSHQKAISDFKGAIGFRDWLAHGRYWKPNLGRNYTPFDVNKLCNKLFQNISI